MLKSQFVPTMQDEFLGMIVNSETCTVSVPQRKLDQLQEDLERFQKQEYITLEDLEKLRGEMNATVKRQNECIDMVNHPPHQRKWIHIIERAVLGCPANTLQLGYPTITIEMCLWCCF